MGAGGTWVWAGGTGIRCRFDPGPLETGPARDIARGGARAGKG